MSLEYVPHQLGPGLRRGEPARRVHQRGQAGRLDQGHHGRGAEGQSTHGVGELLPSHCVLIYDRLNKMNRSLVLFQ